MFADVAEDVSRQKLDVAITYLDEMKQQLEIESKERFVEEKLLREKFKEYLIEKMGISIRESEKILCEVREQYLK